MKLLSKPVLLAVGLITAMALFSCQKQEDETVPVLTVKRELVSAKGDEQKLEVASTSAWTLSVDYVGGAKDWIELERNSGESGIFKVKMKVLPNEGENSRQATLTLKGITLKVTKQISQAGVIPGAPAPLWMELPALDQPDLYFFTHDWTGGNYAKTGYKRSYSFYWDAQNYVSHWVAYPLNTGLLKGNYGRYDEHGGGFPADPILTSLGMKQPELWDHSYGGGWTRGHQIPSADRQENEAVNKCTYYVTNMTPQQYDFNGKIWASLEGKVRTFAKNCDTLYVVSGCHITSSSGWSGTNGGVAARVPTAYYKALLRMSGNDYSAIAYYLPHQKSIATGQYSTYMLSVKELENTVGVDFFVNLPTVVGAEKAAAIESANPSTVVSKW